MCKILNFAKSTLGVGPLYNVQGLLCATDFRKNILCAATWFTSRFTIAKFFTINWILNVCLMSSFAFLPISKTCRSPILYFWSGVCCIIQIQDLFWAVEDVYTAGIATPWINHYISFLFQTLFLSIDLWCAFVVVVRANLSFESCHRETREKILRNPALKLLSNHKISLVSWADREVSNDIWFRREKWGKHCRLIFAIKQCFSTGVPQNLRIPRVAARGRPKQTEIAWDEIRNHSSMRL